MKFIFIGCIVILGLAAVSLCAVLPQTVESIRFLEDGQVEVATTGNVGTLYRLEFSSDSVNWEEHSSLSFAADTISVDTQGGEGTVEVACFSSTGNSGSADQIVATFPLVDVPQSVIFTDAVPAGVSQGFWRISAQTSDK